ncbi:MAG TPA: FKBP-type peptidyl-prolyl cis-trans isomerase [Opitutaceae bacterium]|nr:FKBP-type peptidyl-prolyl cis-trans isomerase [Opitutaceae bacterium]HND59833.1 FKBP-type peptidyl-prolyl cis-trans isomerase [Opitutaceae bacterium]
MRNLLYVALLGLVLLTLALVVRSGLLARKEPGRPINAAMREAMAESAPQFSEADMAVIREKYGNAHRLHSGLLYVIHNAGTGSSTPRLGQEVIVHYDGRLLDGSAVDSSYKRGAPFTFRLGSGMAIQGFEEAFLTMRKGERRTLIIPYWLGYGVSGNPPTIPPRATLVFEVELLDIR